MRLHCKHNTCVFLVEGTLYGPMHSKAGIDQYKQSIAEAQQQGGKVECGGKVNSGVCYFSNQLHAFKISDCFLICLDVFANPNHRPLIDFIKSPSVVRGELHFITRHSHDYPSVFRQGKDFIWNLDIYL